ncbi:DUF4136 domain-containing protein [candidate division KSB1 bacterium]|nr:DUF4136 domain-containing protein [candidate division KSB1 bacterium]
MKSAVLFLTLGVLALMTGCSSVNIKHDYDTDTNFATLKTYAWMAAPTNANGSVQAALSRTAGLDKRIKESADRQLAAKGYTTDANNPDFLVLYHVGAEDKINVTDWGYGYGRYGRWYGGRGVEVYQYKEGTLILDVIDARSKQLVWRGFAAATIDPNASMETRKRKLDEVIAKILAEFPPAAK